jgi:hypothetical protein
VDWKVIAAAEIVAVQRKVEGKKYRCHVVLLMAGCVTGTLRSLWIGCLCDGDALLSLWAIWGCASLSRRLLVLLEHSHVRSMAFWVAGTLVFALLGRSLILCWNE